MHPLVSSLNDYLSVDYLAAIDSRGFLLGSALALSSKIPLIGFHGTDDLERPYEGIQDYLESVETLMIYWADSYGIETASETNLITNDNRSITHRFYNSEDEEIEISYFTIAEGQHDWFDIEIDDDNLNQLIWQFMSRFKKQDDFSEK